MGVGDLGWKIVLNESKTYYMIKGSGFCLFVCLFVCLFFLFIFDGCFLESIIPWW